MDLIRAKTIIYDDSAGAVQWALASAIICTETEGKEALSPATLRDLLECLKRGGAAMSTATCTLYGRTGRKWPSDPTHYSHDPIEWEQFLRGDGYLTD